ncbi:MAG: transposase, partial [Lactobacillales bacterium]|nr:transposase [Lactobacillales bacterium]
MFKTYVAEFLVEEMNNDDVLVLDNLSSHKVKGVVDPLIEKGVKILYLPPYSPDLNPIELMWSKVKSVLRRLKA